MITEDCISFETAKLLKKNGFDCNTNCYYIENSVTKTLFYSPIRENHNASCTENDAHINVSSGKMSAPTIQIAMKWLREVHNIHPNIVVDDFDTVAFYRVEGIFKSGSNRHWFDFEPNDNSEGLYNTYEKACEAAIKYCLENLI